MKRLIKSEKYIPTINDKVVWKKHPYDKTVYTVTDILGDGTIMMDNGEESFIGINPNVVMQI